MKRLFLVLVVTIVLLALVQPASATSPLIINTWVHTSQGLGPDYPSGWTFAFSPNYQSDGNGVVFMGTTVLIQGALTSGIFKSTDSGVTWTGTAQINETRSLVLSPQYATDHLMIAGTAASGVWKTSDQWDTTTEISGDLPDSDINLVAFSPNYAVDHQIFAGTRDSGFFVSNNLGTNWSHIGPDSTPDYSRITAMVFTPDYATSHTFFIAASSEGSGLSGIYRGIWNSSTVQWTHLINGLNNLDVNALAISPNYTNDHTLYVGTRTGGLYQSTNSGGLWSQIDGSNYLDAQTVVISPDYAMDHAVYLGEDGGGVYRYVDNLTNPSLSQMNHGFDSQAGSVTTLAFAPGAKRVLFAGVLGGDSGGAWQFLFPPRQFIPFVRR